MSESKYTNEDLKIMQSWSLERKIQVTQTRIIEWYQRNNGKVYVSFSGGKDSTVLLDLTRRIYPDVKAVFVDTGLEYPELREFVKIIPNVTWLKPKINFRKVIEKYGYPLISKEVSRDVGRTQKDGGRNRKGEITWAFKSLNGLLDNPMANKTKWKYLTEAPFQVSNQCCDVMKKKPLHEFEQQTGLKPIIATMASESKQRRMQGLKNGCNSFDMKNPSSKPISFWTEQDVLTYLFEFNIQYAPIYGNIEKDEDCKLHTTNLERTGCIFCGFGCHIEKDPNRFQRLKQTHPKLWDYCMRSWSDGGLGMREVLDYIGVKCE